MKGLEHGTQFACGCTGFTDLSVGGFGVKRLGAEGEMHLKLSHVSLKVHELQLWSAPNLKGVGFSEYGRFSGVQQRRGLDRQKGRTESPLE